jgi:hypothetical protein
MNMRYFIGFLGIVAILIFIIVLIVRGGGNPAEGPKAINLADYATSSSQVVLTIDGPVAASQTHQSVKVFVDQSQTTIELIQGYEGQVINSKSYSMNPNSYAVFLLSLKHAGFVLGDTNPDLNDERGYCPEGSRFIYELQDNNKQLQRYWNTSCGAKQGTFKGQGPIIRKLFKVQVPDYDEITTNVQL